VKDIEKSLAFYELFGLKVIDGGYMNQAYPDTPTEKWRILQHESVVIGLFQGVFEKNMLTFNPQDVRAIQKALKKAGVALTQEADENTTGPASIMLEDPDGNPILFDQF
jgi:catechol 2,3-dioxygenase-like lactoylglutathione lyase family enzyme